MNAVIAAVRTAGVAETDLRTTGINLNPVYDRQPTQVVGYVAQNQVRVTVRDVARTGILLDAAVSAGANLAGQVQFGVRDESPMRRQALEQAVRDARARAEAIATAAGLRVTGVQSLQDESPSGPTAPEFAPRGAMLAADAGPVPVQPGTLAVTARVRVVYTIG
jgi:hypothetical protein